MAWLDHTFKVALSLNDYEKLNSLIDDFGNCFSPQQEFSAEQAFWFHILNPTIEPSYSPPVIVEVPSELPKVSLVNASLKKLKFHLTQFDSVVKKRTTPSALEEGEWGFEHTKAVFNKEIIPFLKSLKDIFNVFDKDLLNEITEVQTVFDQMEASVQQFSVDKKCLEIAKKEILLENDRLLQKIVSQDVMLTVINSVSWNNDSVNMKTQMCDSCEKCMNLDAELSKSKQAYNDLLKNHSQLEKHCISLKVSMQLKQEVFQNDESCVNQNAVEIQEYFEINDLKARLQDKHTAISKLKDIIKSLENNTKEKNVHHEKCDLEPIKDELENSMFKLDLVLLPLRLLQNKEVHINYLRNTQEQDNILRGIVEQVKAKQPLDGDLDLACKYAARIQELFVYVQDMCPNRITPSIKKVESSNTSNSNTPVLSLTPSRNKKNKVEAQPRKVNKMNHVVKPVCDVDVKQSLSNANSDILCATCNKSMFDGVHDKCLLDLVIQIVLCCILENTCFIRNLEGVDLLSGSRDTNLYTISLNDMLKSSPICLLSKASKTKSWLWHRRLSHLNFACALGKSKKTSHQPKAEDTNQEKLYLLHMDLCGPMRVASINGKRYILVIVDDYSRFTWVRFLKTKDEAPAAIIKCIKNIQVHLKATVQNVQTDNGTEFVNQTLREWYENVGISHQTSVARTPQLNGQEVATPRAKVLTDSLVSTSIDQDALSTSIPSSQEHEQSPIISQGFEELPKTPTFHDDPLNESPNEDSNPQGSSSNMR
ncbi:retrovirus-related pol polyprotein from transposon TNT 1-94 [Tanacetum coccineum]